MPLQPGNSRQTISSNISEMVHSGYPQKQAVAASLSNASRHPLKRDIGGIVPTQTLQDQNPNIQNALQQLQKMTPEQLQQTVLRLGPTSEQGQMANKVLQQKRMMPTQTTAQAAAPQSPGMAPVANMAPPQPQQAAMADGGMLKRADGGMSPGMESPWWERSEARDSTEGYLHGSTLGRADAIRTTAPSGSYVIPADVVSGLGEGNSLAGARILESAMSTGPWGTPLPRASRGSGPPRPPAPRREAAAGGGMQAGATPGAPVPVMLSHGEFVIPSEVVRSIGNGSQKSGWKVLDHLVLELRQRHIEKLKKLPAPAK